MVYGEFKANQWVRGASLAVLIAAGYASLAFGQGGQTEIAKTTPSTEVPKTAPSNNSPAAPAPATQAPATAAQPGNKADSNSTWQANVAQPQQASPETSPQNGAEVVAKVNDYFNKLTNLQGVFVQIDPDNREKRGRFYFERPGKVRFDYAAPPDLRIVSDGRYVAIENYRDNTSEKYPLDVTPFRLLLSPNVDLANDAKILGIDQGPDTIILTLEDKKGDVSGRIRLFLNKEDMSLKEWIITDAQGLDTRIEVSDLEQNKKVAANFFELSAMLGR